MYTPKHVLSPTLIPFYLILYERAHNAQMQTVERPWKYKFSMSMQCLNHVIIYQVW